MTPKPDQPAQNILRRANALNISITKLCNDAGVSRRWFEYFKKRTPKAVEAYIKIERVLIDMEEGSPSLMRVTFTCPNTLEKRQGVIQEHNGRQYIYCKDTNDSYPIASVLHLRYNNPNIR